MVAYIADRGKGAHAPSMPTAAPTGRSRAAPYVAWEALARGSS